MSQTRSRSILLSCGLAALLLSGLVLGLGVGARGTEPAARRDEKADIADGQTSSLQSSGPITALLPLVTKGYPPPLPVFGVQMRAINETYGLSKAVDANVHWVRYQAFEWDRIEPARTDPPTYNWSIVDGTSLRNAYQNGMTVIAIIQYTPGWAQKYSGSICGPIRADQLDEYAQFLSALVTRYKDPPYNVKYWELGNEPDAPVSKDRNVFGCWGEEGDRYYGGAYYGQMLRYAYPAIKAADPQAQVLIGGLLLDCDPTQPPPGKDCASARFLEGILSVGGGDFFDIVSFHGYALYDGTPDPDERHPYWSHRGGVVLGKADYLRDVLNAYGEDKPLINTEGSLICPAENLVHCNPPSAAFYRDQAEYAVLLYVRNWASDIMATIWYQFDGPGWRYSGMLDSSQNPKPVYHAFRFLTEELGDAWYEGKVTRYPQIKGYSFGAPSKQVWVLVPPDATTWAIDLPGDVTHVYNAFGQDITPTGSSILFDGPIYVERPR